MKKLAVVLICLLISGCSNPAPRSEDSELRLIAAAAGALQILQELGFDKEIVAVDERNIEPGSKLALISTGHSLNIEAILSLQPSHIIIDSLVGPENAIKTLRDNKVKIIELPLAESISDVTRKYLLIGQQLDREKTAQESVKNFEAKVKQIEKSSERYRIAFLYLRGSNAIYLVGGKGSGADSLIDAIGSVDVGAQLLDEPFTPLSAEIMVEMNPQVLLLMNSGYESIGGLPGLRKLPGLSGTDAVLKNQIITIDDRALLNFGPDTISVLELLQFKLQELNVKSI
jgi:iron complex transport system substrate-binding protein